MATKVPLKTQSAATAEARARLHTARKNEEGYKPRRMMLDDSYENASTMTRRRQNAERDFLASRNKDLGRTK